METKERKLSYYQSFITAIFLKSLGEELVKVLFEHILEGESYASALRKAKLKVIQQSLKTPEDWAGYALIGG